MNTTKYLMLTWRRGQHNIAYGGEYASAMCMFKVDPRCCCTAVELYVPTPQPLISFGFGKVWVNASLCQCWKMQTSHSDLVQKPHHGDRLHSCICNVLPTSTGKDTFDRN